MSLGIISELRTFLTQLKHVAETNTFQQKVAATIDKQNLGKAICDVFDSPFYTLRTRAIQLNSQINDSNFTAQRIKDLWISFYQNVTESPDLRAYRAIQDRFTLLLNNIPTEQDLSVSASQLPSRDELYSAFAKKIQVAAPNDIQRLFKDQINRDISLLLSCSTGRTLIQNLLCFDFNLLIKAGRTFQYTPEHEIEYALEPITTLARVSEAGLDSQISPTGINLGHELLHMLFYLLVKEKGYTYPNTPPPPGYPHWEEYCVIQRENEIRAQLGLPQRETHFAGSELSASPDEQLVVSVVTNAYAQMERVLPQSSPQGVQEALIHSIQIGNFPAFQRMTEIAASNPDARIGPLQNVRTPPKPPRRINHPPQLETSWAPFQPNDISPSTSSSPALSPPSLSPQPWNPYN